MEGRLYIARVFTNLDPKDGHVDNDPHFWTDPPTWGICRPDYRTGLDKGDYVFFMSSKNNPNFPQMIFAYLKIKEIITHEEAFKQFPQKRMRANAKINGNIIVDSRGDYHPGDLGAHEDRFDQIKEHYAVGFKKYSRMLTKAEILEKAPGFPEALERIIGTSTIYQKGKTLTYHQIQDLLTWLNHGL